MKFRFSTFTQYQHRQTQDLTVHTSSSLLCSYKLVLYLSNTNTQLFLFVQLLSVCPPTSMSIIILYYFSLLSLLLFFLLFPLLSSLLFYSCSFSNYTSSTVNSIFPLHHLLPWPDRTPPTIDPDLSLDLSGDSPVPNQPYNSVTPLTQEEIQRILWREEEEHLEEKERLRKKDEVKKKRKKHKKEQAEIQRKLLEERRKAEQKALRLELEKEDEERRKQIEEIERRRQEEKEDRRQRQAAEREAREYEKRLEEERRRQEEMLRKELLALEEDEEEYLEEQQEERLEDVEERQEKEDEEEVWLRGDVFQMPPKEPEEPKEPNVFPGPIPKPPAVLEDKLKKTEAEEEEDAEVVVVNRGGLPPGCDISDVTVTCDNAKLTYFPPLSIPELKSLSLEGKSPT